MEEITLLRVRYGTDEFGLVRVRLDDIEGLKSRVNRLVLTNAVVPPYRGIAYFQTIDMNTAKQIVHALKDAVPVLSFVGHEDTAKLLSNVFGFEVAFNRGMYEPKPYDLALAFRLRQRPITPGEARGLKPEDLTVTYVYYI